MYNIRSYQTGDALWIQNICLTLADPQLAQHPLFQSAILDIFCNYYLKYEPQNCFVVTEDNDIPKGYILCAADYLTYRQKLEPLCLHAKNPIAKTIGENVLYAMKPWHKDYPAHFHIDLLPEIQGKGLGKKLIQKLTIHLKQKNVPGVLLEVSNDNPDAIAFYKKCGLEILKQLKNEMIMAVKLDTSVE